MGDRTVELVGSVGELFDAIGNQRGRNLVKRDASSFQIIEHARRIVDMFFKTVAQSAVITERIQRRRRHGVHRVLADQLLDVERVAVIFVLGTGRGPQEPLRLRTFRGQFLPAGTSKQFLVILIGQLGV